MTLEKERTIRRAVRVRGWGVHTGSPVLMVIKPAPPGHGVVFRRVDLPAPAAVPAEIGFLAGSSRGTSLARAGVEAKTVEHLLAAAAGMGVDNLEVALDGPEVPIGDGSCRELVAAIAGAGLTVQERPRRFLAPRRKIRVVDGDSRITIEPAGELRLECRVEIPGHPDQSLEWTAAPGAFEKELAPARTFGFIDEAAWLLRRGLIRGTALDNTVVISGKTVISRGGLRFRDEFVRHKAADLLGDLFLAGGPLRARVVAVRPGHAVNHRAARALREEARKDE